MLFEPIELTSIFSHILGSKKADPPPKTGNHRGGRQKPHQKPSPTTTTTTTTTEVFAQFPSIRQSTTDVVTSSSLGRASNRRGKLNLQVGSTLSSDSWHTGRILNEIYRQNKHIFKKKKVHFTRCHGFLVQNECLSTKVWEWPVLPVVICQSQWCVAHLNYPSRTPLAKDFLLKSGSINHHYLLLRKAFYRVIGAHRKTPQLSARTPHRNFVSMRSRVPVKHMQRPRFVFSWSFLHPGKST